MKNKKGFTLIELLAVIAILAILLILAIPNVIKMFNNAKVNSFVTEAQSIVNTAEKQFMSDQLTTEASSDTYYCYDGTGTDENPLNLSGSDNVKYYIKIVNGKVTYVGMSTDTYSVHKTGENLDVADIENTQVTSSTESGYKPVVCATLKNEESTTPVATTAESCFAFNNGTITGYYTHENNDTTKTECPRNVVIPETIGGTTVTSIAQTGMACYDQTGETSLESITMPNTITTIGADAFSGNTKLSKIVISGGINELLFSPLCQGCIALTEVVINEGTTKIADGAFAPYMNNVNYALPINKIVLPSTLTSIGAGAFYYLPQLQEITIPSKTTSIGEMAFTGSILETLNFASNSQLKEIGNQAFASTKLTNITLPEGLKTIGQYAFSQIQPEGKTIKVTLPSTLESTGSHSFEGSAVSSLTFTRGSGTPKTIISNDSFAGTQLTSITIPSSVKTIEEDAFNNVPLTSLTIENGVESIGNYAFQQHKLTNIKIPNSVKSIGEQAFYTSHTVESICINNSENNVSINNNGFGAFVSLGNNNLTITWNCTQ